MAKSTTRTDRTGERETPLMHVEIPLTTVFRKAAEAVERTVMHEAAKSWNYYCSMSGSLREGINASFVGSSNYLAAHNMHRQLCSHPEFLLSLTQYGNRPASYDEFCGVTGLQAFNLHGAELLVIYFTFLSEYARDIGLTYLLDAEVGEGKFWCNSDKGPLIWWM